MARLGGDEFAIIQLEVEGPNEPEVLATRIVSAFQEPFDIDGHQFMIGISVGVALAPGDGDTSDRLLKHADIALYLAKTEGRGMARFFEPEMDAHIHRRRMLELDLRNAVVENEFEIYYQPLINLRDDRIVGCEALLRWNHPVRGLLQPAEFIPVAEETGILLPIGAWVLRTACVEAMNWPQDIVVAVNLSAIQFQKGDIVSAVRDALIQSGLSPNRLELEITESLLLQDTPRTLSALRQLRGLGVSVALDDFGTEYASLAYYRSFPFDKIKIDQSFVRDMIGNIDSMSIVRAVIGLGSSLHIKTTAEGVETSEQVDLLLEEGCLEVQGHYFSPPVLASELAPLIKKLHTGGKVD